MSDDDQLSQVWHPVCAGTEAQHRHVFHGQLLGQELAVWRDDEGRVNAWENRCPHRGVRLSIGSNLGTHLQCRYHGWSFQSGSGRCIRIPAHPDMKPPATIAAMRFDTTEIGGFVWVRLSGDAALEGPPINAAATILRSLPASGPMSKVIDALASYRFCSRPNGVEELPPVAREVRPWRNQGLIIRNADGFEVVLIVQPTTRNASVVHGALQGGSMAADEMAVLRHHNERLQIALAMLRADLGD